MVKTRKRKVGRPRSSEVDFVPGFAASLLARRKAAGMTLADLSAASGVGMATISKIEAEERAPQLRTAQRLATALGCTLDQLAGGIDPLAEISTQQLLAELARRTESRL